MTFVNIEWNIIIEETFADCPATKIRHNMNCVISKPPYRVTSVYDFDVGPIRCRYAGFILIVATSMQFTKAE